MGRTRATLFLSLSRNSRLKVWLTVCPSGTNSLWTIPWLSKKQKNKKQTNKWTSIWFWIYSFSLSWAGESFAVCHSRLWRFFLRSYSKIHDLSLVITRLKNSGSLSRRSSRSRHTSLRLAFCSVVRIFGTILAHTFLVSKSCVKIWCSVNRFKFNSLLIILNFDDLTSQET